MKGVGNLLPTLIFRRMMDELQNLFAVILLFFQFGGQVFNGRLQLAIDRRFFFFGDGRVFVGGRCIAISVAQDIALAAIFNELNHFSIV